MAFTSFENKSVFPFFKNLQLSAKLEMLFLYLVAQKHSDFATSSDCWYSKYFFHVSIDFFFLLIRKWVTWATGLEWYFSSPLQQCFPATHGWPEILPGQAKYKVASVSPEHIQGPLPQSHFVRSTLKHWLTAVHGPGQIGAFGTILTSCHHHVIWIRMAGYGSAQMVPVGEKK